MEQTAKRFGSRALQALFCALPAALIVLPAYAAAGGPPEGAGGPPGGAGGPPSGGGTASGADLASTLQPLAWAAVAVLGILAAVVLAVVVITFIKNPASPG